LYNAYPFRGLLFTQYENKGIMPYQNFIDYVAKKGAMSFWAHPEAANMDTFGSIKIETREHASDLLQTQDYTGFAVFYEGYNKVGLPGGIWDETLTQYCRGLRQKPVWAIAGLAFDAGGDLPDRIKKIKTVLLVSKLNKDEVLNSMARGRMYAVEGDASPHFVLETFVVKNGPSDIAKTMGEEIEIDTAQCPRIEISGGFLDGQHTTVNIQLIKNGKLLNMFEVISPFHVVFEDTDRAPLGRSYYRVDAQGKGIHLITNPIFVKRKTR
jgi:hypothetical protein